MFVQLYCLKFDEININVTKFLQYVWLNIDFVSNNFYSLRSITTGQITSLVNIRFYYDIVPTVFKSK